MLNSQLNQMQKEAESLLSAALAFQKAGANVEQIRVTPYLKDGLLQVTFTLPVEMQGLEIKVSELPQ